MDGGSLFLLGIWDEAPPPLISDSLIKEASPPMRWGGSIVYCCTIAEVTLTRGAFRESALLPSVLLLVKPWLMFFICMTLWKAEPELASLPFAPMAAVSIRASSSSSSRLSITATSVPRLLLPPTWPSWGSLESYLKVAILLTYSFLFLILIVACGLAASLFDSSEPLFSMVLYLTTEAPSAELFSGKLVDDGSSDSYLSEGAKKKALFFKGLLVVLVSPF